MEEVLRYLALKNQYYEKFHSLTLKFLDQVNQDTWTEMDVFIDNRERILNIIHSYDYKIAHHFQSLTLTTEELFVYREPVKRLLDYRSDIAKRIIATDLELISKMEEIKSDTIRELKRTMETNQQINSFSPPPKRAPKPRKDA